MDDYLLDSCGRALVRLSVDGPGLDELLVPRQPCSGENAGKPPSRRESRPPVSLPLLDLKLNALEVVGHWCGCVARAAPECGSLPSGESLAERAEWLRHRLPVLEVVPWGQRCAEEVIAVARVVSDVVSPPACAGDPQPLEVGTARQIASWAALLGRPVSRASIQRAVADGRLASEMTPDGRVLVRLSDVLDLGRSNGALCVGHPGC